MNRTRKSLSILIFAALAMVLISCGSSDNGSTSSPPEKEQKYVDGHMECSGTQKVETSYDDGNADLEIDPSNHEYDRVVGEIIQNPDYDGWGWYDFGYEDRMFGVSETGDSRWFNGLMDQFDAIVDELSSNPNARFSESATLTFPTACWVEDENGSVILGSKPQTQATSTTAGG